jgi:hypothetical protein
MVDGDGPTLRVGLFILIDVNHFHPGTLLLQSGIASNAILGFLNGAIFL